MLWIEIKKQIFHLRFTIFHLSSVRIFGYFGPLVDRKSPVIETESSSSLANEK
jgi:hypothetical protein